MREGIRILLKLPIAAEDRSGTTRHLALVRLIPLQLKRRGVETRMVLAGEEQIGKQIQPARAEAHNAPMFFVFDLLPSLCLLFSSLQVRSPIFAEHRWASSR